MTSSPNSGARDRILLDALQRRFQESLTDVLEGARAVALVDFPYHRNAGDAAIWAGERAALQALGVSVRYVADAGRYDPLHLTAALPEGPVLLHGGGSVGDLWPWPQGLRERVLRDLPRRRVVQLPQSIHFRDPSAEERFGSLVRAHGGYVLMTRDAASDAAAARLAPARRVLAPDAAFGLGPLLRPEHPATDVLVLARDDVEQASGLQHAAGRAGFPVVDWDLGRTGDLTWQARRLVPRAARLALRSRSAWRFTSPAVARSYDAMCDQVLAAGLALLGSARVVVTDRLHAHLLCTLLDVPHVVLDNSYGKISALHEQWTATSATTHWADDADQALSMAQDLVHESLQE